MYLNFVSTSPSANLGESKFKDTALLPAAASREIANDSPANSRFVLPITSCHSPVFPPGKSDCHNFSSVAVGSTIDELVSVLLFVVSSADVLNGTKIVALANSVNVLNRFIFPCFI